MPLYGVFAYNKNKNTNNAWQPYQRGNLTYDAQNYMTQILLETNTMGVWANYLKANNTNSATGKVVLQMVSLWAAGGWTPNNRTTSTYTAADKVSTDLRESYYSGAWSNSSKATYLYNASNFLTQKTEFGYSAGSWLNDRRTTYTNNAAGVAVFSGTRTIDNAIVQHVICGHERIGEAREFGGDTKTLAGFTANIGGDLCQVRHSLNINPTIGNSNDNIGKAKA